MRSFVAAQTRWIVKFAFAVLVAVLVFIEVIEPFPDLPRSAGPIPGAVREYRPDGAEVAEI